MYDAQMHYANSTRLPYTHQAIETNAMLLSPKYFHRLGIITLQIVGTILRQYIPIIFSHVAPTTMKFATGNLYRLQTGCMETAIGAYAITRLKRMSCYELHARNLVT